MMQYKKGPSKGAFFMNDGGSLQLGDSNDSFIRFLDEVDDVLYLGTHRDGLLDLDQRVFEAGSGLVDLAVSLCDVVDDIFLNFADFRQQYGVHSIINDRVVRGYDEGRYVLVGPASVPE